MRRLLTRLHGLVGEVIREESDSYIGRLLRANDGKILPLVLLIGLIVTEIANAKLASRLLPSMPALLLATPVFIMFPDLHNKILMHNGKHSGGPPLARAVGCTSSC
jgi:hypothetical protein